MAPRRLPDREQEGMARNRPNNRPLGPTGPSPDRVRRWNSQRYHPARFLGKAAESGPVPDQGPRIHPHRYTPDRSPHPLLAKRPLPAPVHDPEHDPHARKFADFDPGTDAAMRVTSPVRPPMRLTRDGRTKPRDFGRGP